MVDPSYSKVYNSEFGGAWTLPNSLTVPSSSALQSQNVSFIPGQVATRLGFSLAFDTTDHMSSLFNWISSLGNLLLWYRSTDHSVRYIDIESPGSAATLSPGDLIGAYATFAEAGARLYMSFFSSAGLGASGARVITFDSGFKSDLAFAPPITYVPPNPTEPGPGLVTIGLHYLGYLIEYRSGFITRPSPDSGIGPTPNITTFLPISFLASGTSYLSWSLTTTWPTGAVNVYAIMTTASNAAQWFQVPGAVQAVTGGVASTITFTINIPDEQLVSTGIDSTDYLTLLTNSVANVPQFLPSRVFTHGDRMVYVTTILDNVGNKSGAMFVSDLGDYQRIAADRNLIQLPGQRNIMTGISLDGSLFILGPQWTYRTADNGGDPSTWATPILVDNRRGTLAVRGVEVAPSGTYAWIASQDGLYFFQGVYPALPISYYQQPTWDRINWNAAQAIIIKDDPHVKKVYCLVCLDDATLPSHLLTWDYTKGFSPEKVFFSYDFLQSYSMGAMEVVKNGLPGTVTAASQTQELWLGSSGADGLLRRNSATDTDPYLDNGFPIFSVYETSLYPHAGTRAGRGEVYQHHGADYRLLGNGSVQVIAYGLDHAQEFDLALVDLSTSPGLMPHRGFDVISEGVSHLFTQGQNLVFDGDFAGT